jgi:hypothetical protein
MARRAEEIGLNRSADFAAACPSQQRAGGPTTKLAVAGGPRVRIPFAPAKSPLRTMRVWSILMGVALDEGSAGSRRAQMPSRSLPLFSRAARSCLRVALSTNASLLPRAAFGRVPPLHDERPPICVPMTITRVALSPSETPVGRFPFRRTSLGVASARPVYNPPVVTESDAPRPHPWRRVVLSHLGTHPRPPPPWPLRTTGRRMRWCGVREIDRDPVIEDAAHSRRRHCPAVRSAILV